MSLQKKIWRMQLTLTVTENRVGPPFNGYGVRTLSGDIEHIGHQKDAE